MNDKDRQSVYNRINRHLLEDSLPSQFINELALEPEFKQYPFNMLLELKNTEQSIKYHPEGNVWNHTMLVVDEAAEVREESTDARAFMWAALLHDIGKPQTTRIRKGKITSYDHDTEGAKLCREFLMNFTDDESFVEKVSALVKYHMHILYVLKGLPYGNPRSLTREVNISDIALLCRCDRFGRRNADYEEEEANYKEFLNKLQKL